MKILALRTHSLSCDPILEPLLKLGHNLHQVTFFQPHQPFDHATLLTHSADAVVMLGQHDDGGGHVPPVEILAEMSERMPFIHICCDGSEVVWWPQLESYRQRAPRIFHVNIDGVADGFFDTIGHPDNRAWTTLCPLDPEPFAKHARPWNEREIAIGFCGGWGINHPRGDMMDRIVASGLVKAVKRPFPDYDGYRAFLGNCKAVMNHAHTGTADHMHVKARVLEAAYAGAVLIEPMDSPAFRYFNHVLSYGSDYDLESWGGIIESGSANGIFMEFAREFRVQAMGYAAEAFWPKAIAMAQEGR